MNTFTPKEAQVQARDGSWERRGSGEEGGIHSPGGGEISWRDPSPITIRCSSLTCPLRAAESRRNSHRSARRHTPAWYSHSQDSSSPPRHHHHYHHAEPRTSAHTQPHACTPPPQLLRSLHAADTSHPHTAPCVHTHAHTYTNTFAEGSLLTCTGSPT